MCRQIAAARAIMFTEVVKASMNTSPLHWLCFSSFAMGFQACDSLRRVLQSLPQA
jgi:hypothetical protein